MQTRGTTFSKVAVMSFSPDETESMNQLSTIWVQSMDQHQNILAYPIDIMVEQVEELYPLKYVDLEPLLPYTAENGSKWLLSPSLTAIDIDRFFSAYLHLEEDAA